MPRFARDERDTALTPAPEQELAHAIVAEPAAATVSAKNWARAVQILDELDNEEAARLVGAMLDDDRDRLVAEIEDLPRRDRARIANRLDFLLAAEAPEAARTRRRSSTVRPGPTPR